MRLLPVLLGALLTTAPAAGDWGTIQINRPLPDITLPDLDGNPVALASLRGKRTVLHNFASW